MNRLLTGILLLLSSLSALGDEYRPAFLELQQVNETFFNVLWKVPAKGGNQRLSLYLRFADDVIMDEPLQASIAAGAVIERAVISRQGGLWGSIIHIDGLSRSSTDVLVRIHWLDGSTQIIRLDSANPAFVIKPSPTTAEVFKTYLVFGIEHIWQGKDHLLFVACLILIAATWQRMLLTVTGFTLAHSLTLSLAALGFVSVPVPPVEAVIALSIVFLAREIGLARRDTLTWRFPLVVSAVFGLLHGLGFASALKDIGLPQAEIPAALLAFNLGVEFGQLAFVMVLAAMLQVIVFAATKSAKVRVFYSIYLNKLFACMAGSVAMFWTIERLASF
ncbi:MAG: HupE/UreJ family protein [Gammaproteobacteria bacterium]|nr:HupE/UreJ family protein [Gammaproteobacteria bacterium]